MVHILAQRYTVIVLGHMTSLATWRHPSRDHQHKWVVRMGGTHGCIYSSGYRTGDGC